jgi:hypothetical protein
MRKLFLLGAVLFGLLFFCGCGINPVATVEGLIPLVVSLIAIASTVADGLLPAEASLITTAQALVTNALNALLASLKSYDANKTGTGILADVQAAFNAVQQNLTQLLSACQVKNQLVQQKITSVVNGIITTISTLEAYIVAKQPTSNS